MTMFHMGGVPIRVHWSLVVLVIAWVGWHVPQGALAAVTALGWVAVFFGSVLLHELGHVVAARRFGISTESIVLLPIGGAARLRMPHVTPYVDLIVSLGGPVANLVLGALALAIWGLTGMQGALVLGAINLLLGLFNLIPAFPMDGGRVLRALLVETMGVTRGRRLTLGIGVAFSVAFAVAGVALGQVWFVVMAVIMGMQQRQEAMVVAAMGPA